MTELLASHGPEVRAPLETAAVNPEPVVEAVVEVVATPGEFKWISFVASNLGLTNQ